MIYSASLIESDEDIMNGYTIIRTREELDKVVADLGSYNKVIIRKDFAIENFTPQSLSEYIGNCGLINPNLNFELDKEAEVYKLDNFVDKMLSVSNVEELIDLAVQNEKQFFSAYKNLISYSHDINMKLVQAGGTISKQKEANDILQKQLDDAEHQLDIERNNKLHITNTLDSLIGRINNQYGGNVNKNKMFMHTDNAYDRILYIKELTRVQFTDSLIYYLKEILRVIYQMPVRVLVIESYYATSKVDLYPNLVPHYKLKERDVVSGDILMLGMQPKLMKDILKNPSKISILIVLDRAGFKVPHIVTDNVEYFYTVSDIKDRPKEVPMARCISYSADSLNIPLIDNFDVLDPTMKMGKYSSLPIVKQIVDVLNS